jgi:hypothetical protein
MAKSQLTHRAFKNPKVAAIFEGYPKKIRAKLMALRKLVFDTAASLEGVGELEETLRWGEPSYLTSASKSGSMIRIDSKDPASGRYSMFFLCQTDLISRFKEMFPDEFVYVGNREIKFEDGDAIPLDKLRPCIALALTYNLEKARERPSRSRRKRGKSRTRARVRRSAAS